MKTMFILFLISLLLPMGGCSTANDVNLRQAHPNANIYYQVFIRSFADSDGDGIGDFNGLTKKLDYLYDLGITAIWMMPFHPTNSHHGYDVLDFYDVNPEYGTMEDFQNLVSRAEELGIKLMMDLVINHTSDQHEWFINALAGDPEYRDFYVWNDGVAYSSFVGGMMDLNFENPAVREEMKNIGAFWLEKGITGFRLDAVIHIYDEGEHDLLPHENLMNNLEVINEFRMAMQEINPDAFVVSEVLDFNASNVARYFNASDSVFNFAVSEIILNSVTGSAFSANNMVRNIARTYATIASALGNTGEPFIDSPILSNHDLDRTGSILNGNIDQLKMAAEILLSLPGNPFIYYGEELGMKGTRYEGQYIEGYGYAWDEARRLPFLWGDESITATWFPDNYNQNVATLAEQKEDENSLFWTYRNMIAARRNNIALMFGTDFTEFEIDARLVQAYIRTFEHENQRQSVLIIHNLSDEDYQMNLDYIEVIYSSQPLENSLVPSWSTAIFEIPWEMAMELIN